MNIPQYSISVWGEKSVEGQSYLEEYMIAEIGSSSMEFKGRVIEPTLVQKVNGETVLSFSIKTKFIEDGELIDNPFVKYLINDRTIKLHRGEGNEWYDFVITNIEQDSENYTNKYDCTASHVYELSKNGYGLVYSSDINNNQGTAFELAADVVSGTEWVVDEANSDAIRERKKNALYTIVLDNDITVTPVISGTYETILAGETVYAFYDDIINKNQKVQILYSEAPMILDDANCINNWDNYYTTTTYDNSGKPNWAETMTYTTTFEGYAYVEVNRTIYDDAIEERVDVYEDNQQNQYYRRTITEYASTAITPNLSTNGVSFSINENGEVAGWTAYNATENFKNWHGKNWLEVAPTNGASYFEVWNSGLVDNAALAGPLTKGDEILVRLTLANVSNNNLYSSNHLDQYSIGIRNDYLDGEGTRHIGSDTLCDFVRLNESHKNNIVPGYFTFNEHNIPVSFTPIQSGATVNTYTWLLDLSGAADGSATNGDYLYFYRKDSDGHFYLTNEGKNVFWSQANGSWGSDVEMSKVDYFYVNRNTGDIQITVGEFTNTGAIKYYTITDPDATNEIEYVWVKLTVKKSVSIEALQSKNYQIIFHSYTGSYAAYIGDFYVSKYETYELTDVTGNYTRNLPIFVGSVPVGQVKTSYKFYDPTITDSLESITYIDNDIAETFTPVSNNYSKVRSIEESKSNRFNILQSICEQFEIWIKFTVAHESNGKIVRNENNAPQKIITFHNYIGDLNYAGFVYGVNLKNIIRTINSEDIVSKLYIEPNTNEGAENGYTTIQKAPSNTIGEEFIYNFNYYINKGLIDSSINADLYGANGYFTQLAELAKPVNQLTLQQSLIGVSINTSESRQTTYKAAVDSCIKELEVQRNKLLKWDKNIPTAYINTPEASPFVQGAMVGDYYSDDGSVTTGDPDKSIIAIVETINEVKNRLSLAQTNLTKAETEYEKLSTQLSSIESQLQDIHNRKVAIIEEFEDKYMRFIREGSWQDDSYIDSELYYLDGLVVSEQNAQPRVDYKISVIDVSSIEGLEPFTFSIGDKTTMEDDDFFGPGVRQEVIVSEIEWYLDDPSKDAITVQNYKTQFEDIFSRIEASVQSVEYHEGSYLRAANVVTGDKTLDTSVVSRTFRLLGASGGEIENPVSNIVQDNNGITSINTSDYAYQMKIMDGKLYTSMNGGQSWVPVITQEGINTSFLKAGSINTSQIQIMSGDDALFLWDESGLNAFSTVTANNVSYVDYAKFVRYDQFGLYGVDANAANNSEYMLSYKFTPEDIDDVLDNDAVTFALTWNGFLLRSTQSSNVFKIDSESGLSFTYGTGAINIGKTGTSSGVPTYGLKIVGSDGSYLNATSSGIDISKEVTVEGDVSIGDVIEGQAADVDTQYCISNSPSVIPFPDTPVRPAGTDPSTGWVSETVEGTAQNRYVWQRTSIKRYDLDTQLYVYSYSGYQCLNSGEKEIDKIQELYCLIYQTFSQINSCDIEYYIENLRVDDEGSLIDAQIDWSVTDPDTLTWISNFSTLDIDTALANRTPNVTTNIYMRTAYVVGTLPPVTGHTPPSILINIPRDEYNSTSVITTVVSDTETSTVISTTTETEYNIHNVPGTTTQTIIDEDEGTTTVITTVTTLDEKIKYYGGSSVTEVYRVYSSGDVSSPPPSPTTPDSPTTILPPWTTSYSPSMLDITTGDIYVWFSDVCGADIYTKVNGSWETTRIYQTTSPELAYETESHFITPDMPQGYQISNEWALSESSTVAPVTGWSELIPTPSEGEEVWLRSVYTSVSDQTQKQYYGTYCYSSDELPDSLINVWSTIAYNKSLPDYVKQYSCSQVIYTDGSIFLYGLNETAYSQITYYFKLTETETPPSDYLDYNKPNTQWTQTQPEVYLGSYSWRITVIHLKYADGTESEYVSAPENVTTTSGAAFLGETLFGTSDGSRGAYIDFLGHNVMVDDGEGGKVPLETPLLSGGLRDLIWQIFGSEAGGIPNQFNDRVGSLEQTTSEIVETLNDKESVWDEGSATAESLDALRQLWQTAGQIPPETIEGHRFNGGYVMDGSIVADSIAANSITITKLAEDTVDLINKNDQYIKSASIARSVLYNNDSLIGNLLGVEIGYFAETTQYKLFICAEGMFLFSEGGVVAYFTTDSMKINNAQILSKLYFGKLDDNADDFAFLPQEGGNLRLQAIPAVVS